jgi:glycosyltransferase involved in cell wall biosynthesis
MKISIVLPIYNEERVITQTLQDILQKVKKHVSQIEVIAVDDGSTDKTRETLATLQKKFKEIVVVSHAVNKGYGAALRSGVMKASFDWVFFTDSDLQFDISEIKKFLPHAKGYDFIVGYRMQRADSPKRRFISFGYNRIVRLMFHLPLRDVDCAFKLMRKKSLLDIKFSSNSFFVSAECMVKAFKKGYRIKEIGVRHFPRRQGVSKVTTRKALLTLFDLARLYREIKR